MEDALFLETPTLRQRPLKGSINERRTKSFDLPRLDLAISLINPKNIENPPESVRIAMRPKESVNFVLTGKKVINTSSLLLLLLLIKMGPIFIRSDENFKSFETQLEDVSLI